MDFDRADLKALERMAYEAVEDSAKSGIIYFEARFCPHILIPDDIAHSKVGTESFDSLHARSGCLMSWFGLKGDNPERLQWVYDATEALIKGLKRGQEDFKTEGHLIATSIRGLPPSWYEDTLTIVSDKNFHGGKIVGVDIAALPETHEGTSGSEETL